MGDRSVVEPIEILLAEDTKGDIELTLEALEEGRITNTVTVVGDGEAAMAHLEHGLAGEVQLPDLILLDLNLPRMDGRELLARLKGNERLMRIPVIVLTTSGRGDDVQSVYGLHANSYVQKPMNADDFVAAVRDLGDYWLSIVTLPGFKKGL